SEIVRLQRTLAVGIGVVSIFLILLLTSLLKDRPNAPIAPTNEATDETFRYSYNFSGPPEAALFSEDVNLGRLEKTGNLVPESIYRVPTGGTLLVTFTAENRLELTDLAKFQMTASGVKLLSGKLVCDLKAIKKPFVVSTILGTVTAHGTKFVVIAGLDSVRVELERGVISLQTASSSEVLYSPGIRILGKDGQIRPNIPIPVFSPHETPLNIRNGNENLTNTTLGSSPDSLSGSF
ncbi:FecR domain-containing protein, partial [bacterium]|nr:FecR domain-containing protein [bacterium]